MKKIYIIDSNVFLNDPFAMYAFEDNDVYILDIVRTEVASKKNENGAVGKNARLFNNEIYKLISENPKEILNGLKINIDPEDNTKYGTLRIVKTQLKTTNSLTITLNEKDSKDHLILNEVLYIKNDNKERTVIFVTEDKKFGADCFLEGITQQQYAHDKLISDIKDIYKGYIYIPIESNEFERLEKLLQEEKKIFLKNNDQINCVINVKEIEDNTFLQHEVGSYLKNLISKIKLYYITLPDYTESTLYPNEFVVFQKSYEGVPTDVELVTFINFADVNNPYLENVKFDQTVSGLRSKSIKEKIRNLQQDMFIHLCKRDYIEIISGLGPAGSGKTLLATAGALEDAGLQTGAMKVTNKNSDTKYNKIYVSRTFVTLEKDLGALPGSEEEKTEPLFRPIKDNLNVIMKQENVKADNAYSFIEFLTFTYLQGRSINNAVIVLDEAQNTHIIDMESFITRSGEQSRIYLTGDPLQVRKQGVGPLNNGLTQMVELFKGCPFFATVYMQQAVRSKKAEYATILLNRIQ